MQRQNRPIAEEGDGCSDWPRSPRHRLQFHAPVSPPAKPSHMLAILFVRFLHKKRGGGISGSAFPAAWGVQTRQSNTAVSGHTSAELQSVRCAPAPECGHGRAHLCGTAHAAPPTQTKHWDTHAMHANMGTHRTGSPPARGSNINGQAHTASGAYNGIRRPQTGRPELKRSRKMFDEPHHLQIWVKVRGLENVGTGKWCLSSWPLMHFCSVEQGMVPGLEKRGGGGGLGIAPPPSLRNAGPLDPNRHSAGGGPRPQISEQGQMVFLE